MDLKVFSTDVNKPNNALKFLKKIISNKFSAKFTFRKVNLTSLYTFKNQPPDDNKRELPNKGEKVICPLCSKP